MIIKKTLDGFLNGELKVYQLKGGYRAGHDAVILASSINAKEGDSCLELGIGSGVVSLCLAHRVKGIKIIGLENNNNMIEISNQSISLNHYEKIIKVLDFDIEVWKVDIGDNEDVGSMSKQDFQKCLNNATLITSDNYLMLTLSMSV